MTDALTVIAILTEILDRQGIEYLIGGSFASSSYGIERATNDIDFVLDLHQEQVSAFVAALGEDFYTDEEMLQDAISLESSYSALHLPTMVKADLFIKKRDAWTEESWKRRQRVLVSQEPPLEVTIASPEEMVLQKLRWYRMGGEVSDNQWKDVQGMLKVQGDTLDFAYLNHWAQELQLTDLLHRALNDAGMSERNHE
jgi:hypothetical protein